MSFREINSLVRQRQREFRDVLPHASDTVYGQVSDYWQGLLRGRQNFLEPEDFNFFRHPGTSGSYGIGDGKDEGEDKKLFDQSMIELVDQYAMPDEFVARFTEPLVGSPIVRPYRNNLFSQNYLKNIAAAWRIRQILTDLGLAGRKLKICEIGAGFGGTLLALHHVLDIESVTVIDIAENLYLASLFLPLCLPDRTHALVTPSEPASRSLSSQLNFVLPSFTDALDVRDFDLVINNASFGEMPLATSQAYIKWAGARLSKDGVLYSFNRHNVGDAHGVQRLSQYGFHRLHMHFIVPMERPSRPVNHLGYEIAASPSAIPPAIDESCLDAVGDLIMCGFDSQIAKITNDVIRGNIAGDVHSALSNVARFFRRAPFSQKQAVLASSDLSVCAPVDIMLRAIMNVLSGAPDAGQIKEALSLQCGLKMDLRLRGLLAEIAKQNGNANWPSLLDPVRTRAPSLCTMAERHIAQGRRAFTAMFRRDLKID